MPRPAPPPLPEYEARVLSDYVTFMQACNHAERTVMARKHFAAARLRDWGLAGCTRANVIAYLSDLNRAMVDEECSEWTVSTYHGHLRSFGQWLRIEGLVPYDPTDGVPSPKRPKSIPNPLSDAEVVRVLSVATGDVRDFINLGLYLGFRAHEIAKVKGEHVRSDGFYVKGKGSVRAVLPITPPIQRMIERHEHQGKGFWFPGSEHGHIPGQQVSLRVGRLFDGIGIDGSCHRNRHTFGTMLARQGVHITRIQQLMRHASLATTQGYMQVAESELRDAVLTLPDFDAVPPLAV